MFHKCIYLKHTHTPYQPKHPDVLGSEGNLLLDRVVGAKISVTTSPVGPDYTTTTKLLNEMILKYAETLRYVHVQAMNISLYLRISGHRSSAL